MQLATPPTTKRIKEKTNEVKSFSIKAMKKPLVFPLHTYPKIVLWTNKRFYFPFQNASFIPVTYHKNGLSQFQLSERQALGGKL